MYMLKGQRPSLLHGSRVTNLVTSCSARLERLEEEPGVVLTILLRLVPVMTGIVLATRVSGA